MEEINIGHDTDEEIKEKCRLRDLVIIEPAFPGQFWVARTRDEAAAEIVALRRRVRTLEERLAFSMNDIATLESILLDKRSL
jgi:hypothetical protein